MIKLLVPLGIVAVVVGVSASSIYDLYTIEGYPIALMAQQHEKYPGQGHHAVPPADFFCSRDATDDAHFCLCIGMQDNPKCPMPKGDDPNPPDDGSEGDGGPVARRDPHCTVDCHEDHCHCKVFCDTMNGMGVQHNAN